MILSPPQHAIFLELCEGAVIGEFSDKIGGRYELFVCKTNWKPRTGGKVAVVESERRNVLSPAWSGKGAKMKKYLKVLGCLFILFLAGGMSAINLSYVLFPDEMPKHYSGGFAKLIGCIVIAIWFGYCVIKEQMP
jgi:hypothetical protein